MTTSLNEANGGVGNWDDHAVNHHVFDALRFRAAAYHQAVTALIEDIYERGLDQRVLVVVTVKFRDMKIEYSPSTGAGNPRPLKLARSNRVAITGLARFPISGPAAGSKPVATSEPPTAVAKT